GLVRSLSSFCYRSMQRYAPTFQSACQSISCCMSATHWMCDACGESTRTTTIIESFPTNGPEPSELRLPAWTSSKIDRQRSPSRPRSVYYFQCRGLFRSLKPHANRHSGGTRRGKSAKREVGAQAAR